MPDRRSNRLNFNHLYYFVTIAKEGSIKRAGAKLGIVQSALSGQLKQFEDFLGKRLFERKSRNLLLNPTGKIVQEYANTIFSQADEMVKSVRQYRPSKLKSIRVGVLPSLSKSHIHEFVVPFWRQKSVRVFIVEGNLPDLITDLETGNLDVILSDRSYGQIGKGLESYRLKPRKIVAVTSRKFEHLKQRFPHSLSGQPLLHVTRHSQMRIDIDHYLSERNIVPEVVGEADDTTLLRIAATRGIGVTILPRNTVKESLNQGHLIQIGELSGINSDMWAMVMTTGKYSKHIKDVVQRFKEKQSR